MAGKEVIIAVIQTTGRAATKVNAAGYLPVFFVSGLSPPT